MAPEGKPPGLSSFPLASASCLGALRRSQQPRNDCLCGRAEAFDGGRGAGVSKLRALRNPTTREEVRREGMA